MTREEAKKWLNKLYARADITDEYGDMEDMQPYEEAVNMAIQALSQEPSDDAISRDAVIKCLERGDTLSSIDHRLIDKIKRLPSVTQKSDNKYRKEAKRWKNKWLKSQKSGKWIELPKALNLNENPCKCSECGHILSFMNHYPKSNFCPNCGAKMESEDEE